MLKEATVLQEAAEKLDAADVERSGRDHALGWNHRDQGGTVTNTVTTSADTGAGLAISRGKSSSPLAMAANAAGYSLPRLAEAVTKRIGRTVARTSLSMAAVGDRPIKRDVAEAIESLTKTKASPKGFAATRANWPTLED